MRPGGGDRAFPYNSVRHSLPSLACSTGAAFGPVAEVDVQGKSLWFFLSGKWNCLRGKIAAKPQAAAPCTSFLAEQLRQQMPTKILEFYRFC